MQNVFSDVRRLLCVVDIFLDIETVPDMTPDEYRDAVRRIELGTLTPRSDPDLYWKAAKGALNAYDGKVVLLVYQVSEYGPIRRLKEWESGERAILCDFYATVSRLQGTRESLRIIGHNIAHFDMPFLYTRMLRHGIDSDREIYSRMVQRTILVDTLQAHLPHNNFDIRGLRHDALMSSYGLPVKETSGGEEVAHYFDGQYDRMLGYSEREFLYAQLFSKMRRGMVSGTRLRQAIDKLGSGLQQRQQQQQQR